MGQECIEGGSVKVESVSRVGANFILNQQLALRVRGAVAVGRRVGQECIEDGSGECQSVSWFAVLG